MNPLPATWKVLEIHIRFGTIHIQRSVQGILVPDWSPGVAQELLLDEN